MLSNLLRGYSSLLKVEKKPPPGPKIRRLVTQLLVGESRQSGHLSNGFLITTVSFLGLLIALLGLSLAWTFGVHLEPTFAPVLA